ncbi:hypothetical protein OSTOST_11952, partial [Ostertagia ostertagi]
SGYAQVFATLSVLFVLISISGLVLGSLPELQISVQKNTTQGVVSDMEPHPILGYIEYASFRQLGMMAMVVLTGVIFFSTLVYFLEKDEPSSQFYSIPAACYGDLTPVTVAGKLVATGAIACGVLVLALPITI